MKTASSNWALKKAVGQKAAESVKSGMRVGIGTGSTVAFFIEALGMRIGEDFHVLGVPTSYQSGLLCMQHGIPLADAAMVDSLDIAVDGADEIDPALNAIKGGGAAHTLEKIIASMAKEFILIADESKLVDSLCGSFPLPVEVIPKGLSFVSREILRLSGQPKLRMAVRKDGPIITENGNFVVDITFHTPPEDLLSFDRLLKQIPGVVETGLFLGLAQKALVAKAGKIVLLTPKGQG